jgi:predicted transcriptional regulator
MGEKEKVLENLNQEYDEYKLVEVSRTVHRRVPPELISLDNLDTWRKRNGDEDIYSSVFRYLTEDLYIGAVLSGFPLDFDCANNPDRARKEALATIKDLKDRFRIPEGSVSIAFSGQKGIAVFVNRRALGVEPSVDLPLVLKSMAEELKSTHGLETLDMRVYHRRALWRLLNSRHPKTGLYKIPLTLFELEKLKIDEIKQMAIQPRPLLGAKEHPLIPEAREWYLKHVKIVKEKLEGLKPDFSSLDLSTLVTDPPCVRRRFVEGAEEGVRNITCFQLAVYYARAGKSGEEIKSLMLDFNSRYTPPLPDSEVLRTVESAVIGVQENRYSVGCSSEALIDFCDREHCPFFMEELRKKQFSPEIRETALKLARSPHLIEETQRILGTRIVREYRNRLLIFFQLLSGKRKTPKEKQITIPKGDPGGGKTHLANTLTSLFKTKKRGRFTEHALDYSDLSNYEVLYLQELMDAAKRPENSTIRFLSSEDEGYVVEVTVRDEGGRFKTEEYRIPPITLIATTQDIQLERQLERRAWIENVDDTIDQTEQILTFKARKHKQEGYELLGLMEPSRDWENLQCLVDMLDQNCEIIVPFTETLKDLFDYKSLRIRGDFDKILSLIRLVTFYHQFQLPYIEVRGKKVFFSTPTHALYAFEMARDALTIMLSGLEKRCQDALPYIKKMDDGFKLKDLSKTMGYSDSYARNILSELVDKGILSIDISDIRGHPYVYSLKLEPESVEEKISVSSALYENVENNCLKMRKEAESFLSVLSHTNIAETEIQKILETMTIPDRTLCKKPFKPDFDSETENRRNLSCIQKNEEDNGISAKKPDLTKPTTEAEASYRQVKPAEPCELCGEHPVEYEILIDDDSVLRRCLQCFSELRHSFTKVKFLEKPLNGCSR